MTVTRMAVAAALAGSHRRDRGRAGPELPPGRHVRRPHGDAGARGRAGDHRRELRRRGAFLGWPDRLQGVRHHRHGRGRERRDAGLQQLHFSDGDALLLKFTGGWSPEGLGGDYEVVAGTGALEGAAGTVRFDAIGDSWEKATLLEGSFTLRMPET